MSIWVIEMFTGARWLPSQITATSPTLGEQLLEEKRTASPDSELRLAEYIRKEDPSPEGN